ncbi:MAG: putative transposase [Kiritimatiellia bacterium]|jgi:putative transposase
MARLPRFCPSGLPQHIIQRGNNRSICFADDQDFAAYAHWLCEYSIKFKVDIHAWVFMTNHVHLLATPSTDDGISLMMQALGRRYVQYFNFTYQRSGTLWEGRYKSSAVDTENYLLICYRYIELNPVRASMVNDPADYIWSSYRCNALGVESLLCTPHEEYVSLGKTADDRHQCYRELFSSHIDGELLSDVREALNKGLALGSERFRDEVEALYGRRVKPAKMGRPKSIRESCI